MPRDPYRYFRVEARELLDQLSRASLDLEKDATNTGHVSQLLRLAHTLKGAARVVKQRGISDLSHNMEETLAPYRTGSQPVPRECIDRVLFALDSISAFLKELPAPENEAAAVPAPEPTPAVRADVADINRLVDGLGEIHSELASMRHTAAIARRARRLTGALTQQLAPERLADQSLSTRSRGLLKARSAVHELLRSIAEIERSAAACVERAERELHQAREVAERLRLLPAGSIFNVLERTARDAARNCGKSVAFLANGGDIRLDGHVLDTVQGALAQIVRNAVVHGIEPEAERTRCGKPAQGHVVVDVTRDGNLISFRCRDDGRGVDLDGVRRALQRKGGLPAGSEQLGATELLRLLLRGGITTAGTVTELAGRGIGFDIVREICGRLGAEVSVQTEPGAGTTVELRAPVSLASFEALIVDAGSETVAIPLDAVRATIRVTADEVAHAPNDDSIVYSGDLLRIVPLSQWVSRKPREAKNPGRKALLVVIVKSAGTTAAIEVDRLHGTQPALLRPLPALAIAAALVAGAHIDAEGTPRLVLDPQALINLQHRSALALPAPAPLQPILIIDDSLTTRMLERSILESAGYQVELAGSAEEGLALARRNHYALFLVDVEMPGMDGFGFVERSRADPLLRHIPSILVTSRDSADDRRRGAEAGAHAYIVKSEFDQASFLEHVARLAVR